MNNMIRKSTNLRTVRHYLILVMLLLCISWTVVANAQQVATGSMSGRIVLTAPIPKVPPLRMLPNGQPNFGHIPTLEQRALIEAARVQVQDQSLLVSQDGGLANALVYLRKPPEGYVAPEPPGEPAIIEVKNFFTMHPRVQIVRVGQPIWFRNAHDHMSNFRFTPTYSESLNFLLQPGQRRQEAYVFAKNEPVPVRIHSDLLNIDSYILAVDHPFTAITGTDGRYEIKDLSAGEHTLFVWHERVGVLSRISVNVEAGKQAEHTLSVPGTEFEEYTDKLTAMLKAIQSGDLNAVKSLMNSIVAADRNSLKLHILQSPNVAVIELLYTQWNLDLNPAQFAVVRGNLAAVKQETAAMPADQIDALHLLHLASFHGRVDVIVELMKRKPSIEQGYHYGATPLAYAAEQGHVEAVAKLIELGADVNFKADYTALQRACIGKQPNVVALLIKHGADVNAARHDAQTALHLSAKNGSATCVKLLLDAGADPAATNASGETPLAEAERYQHKEVIQLLRANRSR